MFGFFKKLFGGGDDQSDNSATSNTQNKSLYDRIGGDAAVNAAVELFYRKVLADDRINSFFEGIDMDKQAAKQ